MAQAHDREQGRQATVNAAQDQFENDVRQALSRADMTDDDKTSLLSELVELHRSVLPVDEKKLQVEKIMQPYNVTEELSAQVQSIMAGVNADIADNVR